MVLQIEQFMNESKNYECNFLMNNWLPISNQSVDYNLKIILFSHFLLFIFIIKWNLINK